MERYIEYLYNLRPVIITKKNNNSCLINDIYELVKIREDTSNNNFKIINMLLNQSNLKYFRFVENIRKEIVTQIENDFYILVKKYNVENRLIDIHDLINNSYLIGNYKVEYFELWKNKIDEFENFVLSKTNIDLDLKKYLYYYIAIMENCLQYLKNNHDELIKSNVVFQHRRVSITETIEDVLMPNTLIIDRKGRDIAEYTKSLFINDKFDINKISKIINTKHFTKPELMNIYIRIIFPTYIFDYLYNNEYEIDNSIVNKYSIFKYNDFINQITNYFYYKIKIPVINWILFSNSI